MRAPVWLIALVLLAIVGLGVYGFFTTPLPLGLSNVIHTPGGIQGTSTGSAPVGVPAGARTPAGQPLVLGATNVVIQSVQRNQDLSAGGRGPVGSFTVVVLQMENAGSEPLTPQAADFRLVDDRGRLYAPDAEATRAVNTTTKHRAIFDTSVPPAGRVVTALAFETAADANALTLRVKLGYGEVELPR
ncbi:MAG: hypothetical protein NVSMB2_03920 [Chloroflexota bacterium]